MVWHLVVALTSAAALLASAMTLPAAAGDDVLDWSCGAQRGERQRRGLAGASRQRDHAALADGLTVLTGYGQWRGAGGTPVRDATRMLLIWLAPGGKTEVDIKIIGVSWKSQQTTPAC